MSGRVAASFWFSNEEEFEKLPGGLDSRRGKVTVKLRSGDLSVSTFDSVLPLLRDQNAVIRFGLLLGCRCRR